MNRLFNSSTGIRRGSLSNLSKTTLLASVTCFFANFVCAQITFTDDTNFQSEVVFEGAVTVEGTYSGKVYQVDFESGRPYVRGFYPRLYLESSEGGNGKSSGMQIRDSEGHNIWFIGTRFNDRFRLSHGANGDMGTVIMDVVDYGSGVLNTGIRTGTPEGTLAIAGSLIVGYNGGSSNVGVPGSMVVGYSSEVLDNFSYAGGYQSSIESEASFGHGSLVVVDGYNGSAFGLGTHAQAAHSFVVGRFNLVEGTVTSDGFFGAGWDTEQPIFVVGNGTAESTGGGGPTDYENVVRSNALTVYSTGIDSRTVVDGDLEVTGTATINKVSPMGGISMGSFTAE